MGADRGAALRWLHAGESVIVYGPVGVGKSHVAQALGHQAVHAGAEVRFAKTSRILGDLADRTWAKRAPRCPATVRPGCGTRGSSARIGGDHDEHAAVMIDRITVSRQSTYWWRSAPTRIE